MTGSDWVWQGAEREAFSGWLAEHGLPSLDDHLAPTLDDPDVDLEWRGPERKRHRVFGPSYVYRHEVPPVTMWSWHGLDLDPGASEDLLAATAPGLGDADVADLLERAQESEELQAPDGPRAPVVAWTALLLLANRATTLSPAVREELRARAQSLGRPAG